MFGHTTILYDPFNMNPNPVDPDNLPAQAQTPSLDILLEDGPLIALNKPAGLLTQGVPNAQTSLESQVKVYLKSKMNKPGRVYLGVPHRLDRPVSGVIVFAKNSKAAARLAEQFRERLVRKIYLAVTEGIPQPSEGTMIDWLLKDAVAAHVNVVTNDVENAKRAVLDYEVIAVRDNRALVRIQLHTGRMHQIRVQFASRGWPIVHDLQYGAKLTASGEQLFIGGASSQLANDTPILNPSSDAEKPPVADPSCDADKNPLTPSLSSQSRGEGARVAQRANDIPILNPSCDAEKPPVAAVALHAWRLQLKHPIRYEPICLEAPVPDNWSEFGFVLPKDC